MNYTVGICRIIECKPEQILETAPVQDDSALLSVLVDCGNQGIKEYHLAIIDLAEPETQAGPEPEPPQRRRRRKNEAQP